MMMILYIVLDYIGGNAVVYDIVDLNKMAVMLSTYQIFLFILFIFNIDVYYIHIIDLIFLVIVNLNMKLNQ